MVMKMPKRVRAAEALRAERFFGECEGGEWDYVGRREEAAAG
jgi:hypothetical protein